MTDTHTTQVDHATDLMEAQIPEGAIVHAEQSPDAPQTPFPTSLFLSREQEDRMMKFAMDYIEQLELEMGRVVVAGNQNSIPNPETHLGKREMFTMRYYNHVQDRALLDPGGLYGQSNITATLSQRTVMQMVARSNNFFFGTDPWYSANFIGVEDRVKAEKVDRHSKWKFDQTGLRLVHEEANEFAFVRGESVIKSTYLTRDRHFMRKGKALFDGATGAMVTDQKGNPIFIGAKFVPETQQAPVTPEMQQQGVPPQTVATGKQVLGTDPTVYLPKVVVWRDGTYPMRQRLFEGPEAKQVFYKDFLCPLSAPNIQDAELICHLYDMPVMSLVQTFRREDLAAQGAAESFASLQKAVDAIRNAHGGGVQPTSGALQPRTDFKEQGNQASPENPYAQIAEVYMTYDANGDGMPEEIMLVIDLRNKFPLFYDYLDNITPKGKRPFSVIRAKAVDGRWYGFGAMEFFQPEQEFIDLLVNRRNFRMSKAGRVTFWNPSVTIEGQSQPNLVLNDGKTYRLREGYKAEDALSYVSLPEEGADLMEMLNFFNQLMQLKSGVINAGDQKSSSMDTGDTATGIRNVEKSGQEMFAQWLTCLEPGHRDLLLSQITLLYSYLSESELFRFFDSGKNQVGYDSLSPEEVADMEFDVTVLLTRVRAEQVLQMSAEARALLMEFYTNVPPQIQPIVAPFYRDSLKALGYSNANDLIVAQPMPMLGAPQSGGGGDQPQAADGSAQIAAAPQSKQLNVPPPGTPSPTSPTPAI